VARVLTLTAVGLAVALAALGPLGAGAPGGTPGTATATGYAALLPHGIQGPASATSTGPHERSGSVGGLRPAGGGTIGGAEVLVGAAPDGAEGVAEGTVRASGITLLDGRVSISGIRMSARATAGPAGAEAALTEATVEGLAVDGRAVAAGPGSRVEVAGIGTLVFLESVADGAGLRANALRVEVTDPQAAALIGQPFVVGHLDLSAVAGAEAPAPEPAAPSTAPGAAGPGSAGGAPPRRARTPSPRPTPDPEPPAAEGPLAAPPPLGLPRRPAPEIALPPGEGYVFPVLGEASFTDDYGAPRAVTGWHHGNDIFATTGTPVLAMADGTLSRVGINTLGGNRLWLTDEAGNEFYYAHLSAYAPASISGARVRAGQVIAFVGNTGQAITTPPHLHFEVHPQGGDSVNPYPYLVAWRRGSGIPLAFRQAAASPSPAPSMGAVLVEGTPELDEPAAPDGGLAVPVS
jgi:murein DD-endopeptidase MepM/ murein hydrolase activator NlpD